MTSPSGPPQGAGGFSGQGPAQGFPPGPTGSHAAPPNNGGLQQEVHTLERAIFEVKRIIVGQDQLVERMLVGLLAKGHVLLEGVPGVAKTLAVETFAKVVGGSFSRVQFTRSEERRVGKSGDVGGGSALRKDGNIAGLEEVGGKDLPLLCRLLVAI